MPKTRNITRSQWENANTAHASTTASTRTTRSKKQNENEYDSEKENTGRQGSRATHNAARTRNRAALGVLGTTNVPMVSASDSAGGKEVSKQKIVKKTAAKGKGKPTPAPLKQKKMPLQDITAEFLPAPEAANRGQGTQGPAEQENQNTQDVVNRVITADPISESVRLAPIPAPRFTSPLPPSSPPSEHSFSPHFQTHSHRTGPSLFDAFAIPTQPSFSQAPEPLDPWQEFDSAQPVTQCSSGSGGTSSDPFGFVSLERKLKEEREAAAAIIPSAPEHHDSDEDNRDDTVDLPVADTSSPRPVRRLKRTNEDTPHDGEDYAEAEIPHYKVPAIPRKDKQKRRRISEHEGHDIFSPCSSSIGSSPSPSKVSARKLPRDPLDDFNEDQDYNAELQNTFKKRRVAQIDREDAGVVSWNLRSREKRPAHESDAKDELSEEETQPKRSKSVKRKPAKKTAAKKQKATTEDEDAEEKWELDRQGRIDYFKRLDEYEVETEDVYFI